MLALVFLPFGGVVGYGIYRIYVYCGGQARSSLGLAQQGVALETLSPLCYLKFSSALRRWEWAYSGVRRQDEPGQKA